MHIEHSNQRGPALKAKDKLYKFSVDNNPNSNVLKVMENVLNTLDFGY